MRSPVRRAALLVVPALAVAAAAGCGDDDSPAADVDMIELRGALQETVCDEFALAFYDNPGSREHLVEQANDPAGGYYEPDVYERITADGEVTLDEFNELTGVDNAVLHRCENVVEDFERRAVGAAGGNPEAGG